MTTYMQVITYFTTHKLFDTKYDLYSALPNRYIHLMYTDQL